MLFNPRSATQALEETITSRIADERTILTKVLTDLKISYQVDWGKRLVFPCTEHNQETAYTLTIRTDHQRNIHPKVFNRIIIFNNCSKCNIRSPLTLPNILTVKCGLNYTDALDYLASAILNRPPQKNIRNEISPVYKVGVPNEGPAPTDEGSTIIQDGKELF